MKYAYTIDGVKKEVDLKPCPFCGGRNLRVYLQGSVYPTVQCLSKVQYPGGSEYCAAQGPIADIGGWNKRAEIA